MGIDAALSFVRGDDAFQRAVEAVQSVASAGQIGLDLADYAAGVDDDTVLDVVLTVGGLISPYTYSDMTGAGLNLVVNPPG